jgi:hypothetical protein
LDSRVRESDGGCDAAARDSDVAMSRTGVKALLLLALAVLMGCDRIRVVDAGGAPVRGAQVTGVALSTSSAPVLTDADGWATVPGNVQGTRWISIACSGFASTQVPAPARYPATIVLERQ